MCTAVLSSCCAYMHPVWHSLWELLLLRYLCQATADVLRLAVKGISLAGTALLLS